MIPLLHDFAGQTVLVFGGGPVGARKARFFAADADVIVVSPTFAGEDFGGAEQVREMPDEGGVAHWLEETRPALVVAATDDETVNDAIEAAASERGILCNRADESGRPGPGRVLVPATVRSGSVTMAISTGGKSPALSRHLRTVFEEKFAGAGQLADLTESLREELAAQDIPTDDRRSALRAVVESEDVWKALDTDGSKPEQVATTVMATERGDSA